jgi:hypothetical protein
MRTILIFAASVLLSVSAFANKEKDVETMQLKGSIVDDKNQEALAGATIYVNGKKYYSDFDGNFSISDITEGKHQIKVEFISYEPFSAEVDVKQNESININLLQMSYEAASVAEVNENETQDIALLHK